MHKNYKIIDGHIDLAFNALQVTGKDALQKCGFDESMHRPRPQLNQADYERMRESGYTIFFGIVFPLVLENGGSLRHSQAAAEESALQQLTFYNQLESTGKYRILRTKQDLEEVVSKDDLIGIFILMEDAIPIREDISNLQRYYEAGLRAVGPVWNWDNQFGGGTDTDSGLSHQGELLLQEMTELGMALDTAHMNPTMFNDSLSQFQGQVLNSHAGIHALCPHRRNLRDDQLRLLHEAGAVLGIPFVPEFLHSNPESASLYDVVEHIHSAREIIGSDLVALGSDFDGMSWPNYLEGLAHTGEVRNLADALSRDPRFSEQEIENMLCQNWLAWLQKVLR